MSEHGASKGRGVAAVSSRKPRLRNAAIALLGLMALAVALRFAFILSGRDAEVDQLIKTLQSKNRADATWAIHRLYEISEEKLAYLVRFVRDDSPTALERLNLGQPGRRGKVLYSDTPFCVGNAAQLVLLLRLGPQDDVLSKEVQRIGTWASDVEDRWREVVRAQQPSTPSGDSRVREEPPIVPPSQREEFAGIERDPGRLLRLLHQETKLEAVWALEVLKNLPEEFLDQLLSHAGDGSPTRVRHLASGGSSFMVDNGVPVGQIVCFLLYRHMEVSDPAVWGRPISRETTRELRESWKAWREGRR